MSLASACVVTTDDDGDDDDDDNSAGEGGSSSTAGTKSTGGGGSSAGSKTTGGSSGSSGSSAMGGAGGEPPTDTYMPGVCAGTLEPEPSVTPSCSPADNDTGQTCKICLKAKCCEEWKTCFGSEPHTACGWGDKATDDGQFECVQHCFEDGAAAASDPDDLLAECTAGCINQCDTVDNGVPLDSTNALIACANDSCATECFPF
jgi:hypothetical protein